MVRFLTAGESHGQGLLIIVEGVPAGLSLSEEYIAAQLARRQRGYGRGGRMLIEQDRAAISIGSSPRPHPGEPYRDDHRKQGLGELARSNEYRAR